MKAALPLRLVTYLVPSYPVELFETLAQYLEEALGCETTLGVESRFDAPASGRCDPFRAGLADLGTHLLFLLSFIQHPSKVGKEKVGQTRS